MKPTFHLGMRVSFLNGKRRGYGTIYDETPAKTNDMGIPIAQQICVDTGHPRYQKLSMDVDFADVRICRMRKAPLHHQSELLT